MEQKDRYTLRELFNNLDITMTELSKRSGVSDVTLGKIRDGHSARLNTINILLRTFSKIYAVKLSIENVDGIIIQGKPVDEIINPTTKSRVIPTSAALTYEPEIAQNRSTERKKADVPDDLPEGTVKLIDFVERYNLPESSMSRWINIGVKKGEKIQTTTRPKSSGMGMQHYLTPTQQTQAIEMLKRHGKLKDEKNPAA